MIATATDSKNIRRGRKRATRTWRGRILEIPYCTPDGTLVRGPKALCELQCYVDDALLRVGELPPRHSRPKAPLGSDHSRHCGPFPGSPSRVIGQATWRSIVPIDGP